MELIAVFSCLLIWLWNRHAGGIAVAMGTACLWACCAAADSETLLTFCTQWKGPQKWGGEEGGHCLLWKMMQCSIKWGSSWLHWRHMAKCSVSGITSKFLKGEKSKKPKSFYSEFEFECWDMLFFNLSLTKQDKESFLYLQLRTVTTLCAQILASDWRPVFL